jgi:uncharacterized phiE125 gp8 family phage protein
LRMELPCWPMDGQVRLPIGPVQSVSSVKYYDAGGVQQTLVANADYQAWVGYRPPTIFPAPQKFWPVIQFGRVPAVTVDFVAGYGDTGSAVPAAAQQAILMTIGYWASNRGDEEAPGKFGLSEGAVRLIERHLKMTGYR